jgi:hypothetical protein
MLEFCAGLERAEAVRQHLQQARGTGPPFARVRASSGQAPQPTPAFTPASDDPRNDGCIALLEVWFPVDSHDPAVGFA